MAENVPHTKGHAHCTSGAPTCSEIPHSPHVPSYHGVPWGGTVRVLVNSTVKPTWQGLRNCPPFRHTDVGGDRVRQLGVNVYSSTVIYALLLLNIFLNKDIEYIMLLY